MKKHIIGVIIFSFIVGTSAFVAAFFYQTLKSEQPQEVDSSNVYVTSEPYTHSCWKGNRNYETKSVSPKVTQAILDRQARTLETELFIQIDEKSSKNIKPVLHFFVKDGNSTRYLATYKLPGETMDVTKNHDMSEIYDTSDKKMIKAEWNITLSLEMLGNINSYENLYVVPEIVSNVNSYRDYTPVFDELNATPVTVAH